VSTLANTELGPAILERARSGDHEAFAALVRLYDAKLRGLAFRVLGDRDRMDDALQEAYVRAFRALPRFRGDARMGTWLFRITYNACLDELARGRKVTHVPLDELVEQASGEPQPGEALSYRSQVVTALRALPADERAVVFLVDVHGFDYAAAAELVGVPVGTVASRLNRARRSLRRALLHRGKGSDNEPENPEVAR
jgi:RNA polymerase sigma-70 factor (ECF subfamily)